ARARRRAASARRRGQPRRDDGAGAALPRPPDGQRSRRACDRRRHRRRARGAADGSGAIAPLIAFRNVTKTFETGYTALRDVEFEVEPERFVALVGPSGCGKSTTLSLISGLDRASSGVVEVRGKAVEGITSGIGFLFQRDAL